MPVTSADAAGLTGVGFVHLADRFTSKADAWDAAGSLINAATPDHAGLDVLGEFAIAPLRGPPSRDFQTLHHDFGLPLVPAVPADIALFTALHVAADAPPSAAATRLVSLRSLLSARVWPDRSELVRRFAAYAATHGAWDDTAGYAEGSLARVVEAALGEPPALPSVQEPGFLCGTEFESLAAEEEFFARRGLSVDAVSTLVGLQPGELLVFDNLMLAHGRAGIRQPGELHQRIFGFRKLGVDLQAQLRDRVLAAFAA